MLSSPGGACLPFVSFTAVLGTPHQPEKFSPSQQICYPTPTCLSRVQRSPAKITAIYGRLRSGTGAGHRGFLTAALLAGALYRVNFRGSADRVNPQDHAAAHLSGLQIVPFPDIFGSHAKLVRHSAQGIAFAYPVTYQPALGLFHRPRRRNDQFLTRGQSR